MSSLPRSEFISLRQSKNVRIVELESTDFTNRLTRARVLDLITALDSMRTDPLPLVITGNQKFFSAGADLNEIAALTGTTAHQFAQLGQQLMNVVAGFPAPVCAAINGYCMGGGLDLALACHYRIANPDAILAHRGASLGLITGWGGTQRLSRIIGKPTALQMFVAAEKIGAKSALKSGLIDHIAKDPVHYAVSFLRNLSDPAQSLK